MQQLKAIAGSAAGLLGLTSGDTVTVLPGQVEQAWLPVLFLYVPSRHAWHCELLVLVYPRLHTQCALVVLAGRLTEFE